MPNKSIMRLNTERDAFYKPYCMRCRGLVRMEIVKPFLWKCKCGAEHDERRHADGNSWIVSRRATGEVIGEFFEWRQVSRFDPRTCLIEISSQYLERINKEIASASQGH